MLLSLVLGGVLALGQPSALPPVAPRGEIDERPARPAPTPEITLAIEDPSPTDPDAAPDAPAPPDRRAVMSRLRGTRFGTFLDDHRVTISGWTEGAFTASTDRIEQLPMGFNYRANQFLLQQNWLRIERTVDPDASTPTWGFRSDTILPGTDYRFTLPRGLFNGQLTANDGKPNLYGIDPVQFYGELHLPHIARGLDVRLGRFFVLFGPESIDTTLNVLFSRSYTFLYDPFTHTGLVTALKLNDAWTVQNGIVTGSDMFVGPEANATYIGSIKWAPPDGRDSLLLSVILGKGRYDVAHDFSNPQVFDLVFTHRFTDRLNYTFDALYSFQNGFPGGGAGGFANDWGGVQYLAFQLTPTVGAAARQEFFGDPQGQRTGTRGFYQALTAGVSYKPKPWLWFRPEVRYDYSDGRAFEGHSSLFTAALNCVIRW
jgi:hypothetical protein